MENKLQSYLEIIELFERDMRGRSKLERFERGHGISGYIVSGCTAGEVHRLLALIAPYRRMTEWRDMFRGKTTVDGGTYGREPRKQPFRVTRDNHFTAEARKEMDRLTAGLV